MHWIGRPTIQTNFRCEAALFSLLCVDIMTLTAIAIERRRHEELQVASVRDTMMGYSRSPYYASAHADDTKRMGR